jgi:hypothetical protein
VTIEIRRPELEALILERMRSGAFQSIEDVLLAALGPGPAAQAGQQGGDDRKRTGADLVAAMQDSPHKDISLEPERGPLPVRDVSI